MYTNKKNLKDELKQIDNEGLYKREREIQSKQGTLIEVKDKSDNIIKMLGL